MLKCLHLSHFSQQNDQSQNSFSWEPKLLPIPLLSCTRNTLLIWFLSVASCGSHQNTPREDWTLVWCRLCLHVGCRERLADEDYLLIPSLRAVNWHLSVMHFLSVSLWGSKAPQTHKHFHLHTSWTPPIKRGLRQKLNPNPWLASLSC